MSDFTPFYDETKPPEYDDPAWYRDPPAPPTDFSFFVPRYVDVYHATGYFYMWFRVVTQPGEEDLCLERCSTDGDDLPEWLDEEIREQGLDEVVPINHFIHEDSDGCSFRCTWLRWGLENGVAPGQPFLVRISKPVYDRDYWGEVDCDWDREIVHVEPWPLKRSHTSWEKALARLHRNRVEARRDMRRLRELRAADLSAMFLQRGFFGTGGYEDAQGPRGIFVHLCTSHDRLRQVSTTGYHRLLSGRDDHGNEASAMRALVRDAAEHFPHLAESQIRSLPWKT